MTTSHTPGPWSFENHSPAIPMLGVYAPDGKGPWHHERSDEEKEANSRLAAAAPGLLAEIERQYTELADYRNDWPGRCQPAGQAKLIRMRDLIATATGRDAQDVQDDYGTRAALAKVKGE